MHGIYYFTVKRYYLASQINTHFIQYANIYILFSHVEIHCILKMDIVNVSHLFMSWNYWFQYYSLFLNLFISLLDQLYLDERM